MMKNVFFISLVATLSACSSVSGTQVQSQVCSMPEPDARKAIVHIDSSASSTASGVVIATNRVISVAHAFHEDSPIYITIDGQPTMANLILLDESIDLALLSVDTGSIKPMKLSDKPLMEDEMVWALGFPLNKGQKLSLGLFQDFYNNQLYTTNHINSGGSGGGLLHCDAGQFALAGVVHGYVAQLEGGFYINIGDSTSIPSNTVKLFIERSATKNIVGYAN